MKPTDPGKCAHPVLLRGEGRGGKGQGEDKFARSAWFCVLGPFVVITGFFFFLRKSFRTWFSFFSHQPQMNNYTW